MRDQIKVIGFATAVCLVCSILLAFIASALKERQEANKSNDIKMKVLSVFGEEVKDKKGRLVISSDELQKLFETKISGIVLDGHSSIVTNIVVDKIESEDMNDRDKVTGLKKYYPLYKYADSDTGSARYAIHVSGKGLWSTIKGYMALETDLDHIAGLIFYEHQETPGLGGEIEKDYFLTRFTGKRMCRDGKPVNFRILKAGADVYDDTAVDGISGATMTCNGVSEFLNRDYEVYNRYFEKKGLRN